RGRRPAATPPITAPESRCVHAAGSRLRQERSLLKMIIIIKSSGSAVVFALTWLPLFGLPGAGHHRHRRPTVEPVTRQRVSPAAGMSASMRAVPANAETAIGVTDVLPI